MKKFARRVGFAMLLLFILFFALWIAADFLPGHDIGDQIMLGGLLLSWLGVNGSSFFSWLHDVEDDEDAIRTKARFLAWLITMEPMEPMEPVEGGKA